MRLAGGRRNAGDELVWSFRIEQGIWELIGQDRTLAAISDIIVEEYDVNREIIEKDLLKLAEDLAAQKLVQVRE